MSSLKNTDEKNYFRVLALSQLAIVMKSLVQRVRALSGLGFFALQIA